MDILSYFVRTKLKCFISDHNFVQNFSQRCRFRVFLEDTTNIYVGLSVRGPLFLSNFNENRNVSPKFSKITHLEVYEYKFIDFIVHVY